MYMAGYNWYSQRSFKNCVTTLPNYIVRKHLEYKLKINMSQMQISRVKAGILYSRYDKRLYNLSVIGFS